MTGLRILTAILAAASFARAADTPLPRDFTVTPTPLQEAPPYVAQVIVPDANCAAVNDSAGLLVVGHLAKDDHHLAVFHLDAAGQPSGEPTWLTLPKPEALAAKANYPLGLLFHPTQPLLYVWQDVDAPPGDKQEEHAEFKDYLEFDHLVIYAIKDGSLELLQTGARGVGFHCGLKAGTIGLDRAARTLFVPNAVGETSDEGGVGVFALDAEGLPGESYEDSTTHSKSKGMQVEVTTKTNKKVNKIVPLPKRNRLYRYFPTGLGWFAGLETVMMGGYSGCMVGDIHNGSLRQTWFNLPDLTGPCAAAGHPTLPVLYLALLANTHLYSIAQVDGYLTMLPQVATVTGAHFADTPVVLSSQSKLAVGDTRSLHLFGLQADGKLDGTDQLLKLSSAFVKGVAWSEKFHRLYVAVDKAN